MLDRVASHAPDGAAVEAVVQGRHGDPFAVLGPHGTAAGTAVRAFLPGAEAVTVLDARGGAALGALERVHPEGFWSGAIAARVPYRLRVRWQSGDESEAEDPYAYPPLLGEMDRYLLAEGRHQDLGHTLGAHPAEVEGVPGIRFAVWAPNARRVSVVGPFNHWDGDRKSVV